MKPNFIRKPSPGWELLVAAALIAACFPLSAHEEHGGASAHVGPENTNHVASTPAANIRLVGRIDPFPGNNFYTDVWGEGSYAYLGSLDHDEFAIINIADPAAPKLVGAYHGTTNGYCADLQVKDGIAYMASDGADTNPPTGVYIVDVSNPTHPVLLSQITAAENGYNKVHNLFLDGHFLYLADFRTRVVKVFDVTVPSTPEFVRDIRTTDRFIHDMTVVNQRLYTSGWDGRTDIYDVTDLATRDPVRLGTVSSGVTSHSSWPNEDGTILASCSELNPRELRIYNISDPLKPVLLNRMTSSTLALDAATPHNPVIVGDLLFVSWYQAGLQVFNIRDPANPLLVGAFDTFPGGVSTPGPLLADNGIWRGDGCWGVCPLLGLDKVLLSDIDGGLFIVDASRLGGPDVDGDRLPDNWETQHSLNAADNADAQLDPDGDGLDNLGEFLSGGNPSSRDERARITRVAKSGQEVQLSFTSPEGRLYSLEQNFNAAQTGWTLVRDEVECTNGVATVTLTNVASARRFFRVQVRP